MENAMVKKTTKTEAKAVAKTTKRVKKEKVEVVAEVPEMLGQLVKVESNGDKLYMGEYSYSTYNEAGDKIKFDIDWDLLTNHMKQVGKVG